MITIFTVPKAFEGHDGIIQTNAIESWLRLAGNHEIILFGDDPGVREAAQRFGLGHQPEIARNARGIPLIGEVLNHARQIARSEILCLVNADIILMDDLIDAINTAAKTYNRFLLVGRRKDIDVLEPIEFSNDWKRELRQKVEKEGKLISHFSSDFFVFQKGVLQHVPPFIIGRPCWDNWVMYEAHRSGTALIDATASVVSIHQNHDFSYVKDRSSGATVLDEKKVREAKENLKLAGGYSCLYSVYDAPLLMKRGKFVSTYWPWYWGRHLKAMKNRKLTQWLADHPGVHRIIRRMRGKKSQ